MTIQEFNAQIKRLSDTYGAQHFKQERLTLLWKRISNFSQAWFERTVDGLISHHRQAPMPSDFEEAISSERERNWKNRQEDGLHEWTGRAACTYCKDTGVYVCSHPTKSGMWAFRCACPRGLQDPRTAIPFYTETHQRDGYVFHEMPVYRGVSA